jgi:hypothetical protein
MLPPSAPPSLVGTEGFKLSVQKDSRWSLRPGPPNDGRKQENARKGL